mmetsp:Transcript_33216/g.93131  ORF Transcript_33216/g.93131 Transcript_33216/m.93131 type:complete len:256 (+) Transcript_33216:1349-2116(+)
MQPLAASSQATPSKRSSPGLKGLRKCFMAAFSWPSASTLMATFDPGKMRPSAARSLATATVSAGGLNAACETHEASSAEAASSARHVRMHREPTMRPTASAVPPSARVRFCLAAWRVLLFRIACARSVPLSSHTWMVFMVGVNLHLMLSKARSKPASRSLPSRMSTASPLQPKEPNTPAGTSPGRTSRSTRPSASCTGVGTWPPSVGLPMQSPWAPCSAASTSSTDACSQFTDSTATPALVRPRHSASASVAVLP